MTAEIPVRNGLPHREFYVVPRDFGIVIKIKQKKFRNLLIFAGKMSTIHLALREMEC